MKNNLLHWMLICLCASLLVVACGGGDEPEQVDEAEPTVVVADTTAEQDEPEPTAAPEEVVEPTEAAEEMESTPEPEAAPAAELGDERMVNADGGYSYLAPASYEAEESFTQVILSPPDADFDFGPNLILDGGPLEGTAIQDIATVFQEAFAAEFDFEEIEELTINDQPAFAFNFTTEEEGETIAGRFIIFSDSALTQYVSMFGGAVVERWESEVSPIFDAVAASVEFEAMQMAADSDDGEDNGGGAPLAAGQGSGEPGIACFGSFDFGVTCLDTAGNWQLYTSENSPLGDDNIVDMDVCADGRILMAHFFGVSAFDGANWSEYPDDWGFETPEAVACDAAGNIWVAHYGGASYYDGSSWTTYAALDIAPEDEYAELVNDIVVHPDGTVWLLTSGAVASFDGAAWTAYQTGSGLDEEYFFEELAISPDGSVWATASSEILQFDGSGWTEFEPEDFLTFEDIVVDTAGNVFVGTYSEGIAIYEGVRWDETNVGEGLASNNVQDIQIDANGRIWAGTAYGLSVTDGRDWVTFRMDNAEMMDHDINALAVVNGGPPLPESLVKDGGSLSGQLFLDEATYPDTRVEICVETLGFMFFGETPCSDQQFFLSTVTDSDGFFRFEDVPEGYYIVVAETDDGWAQLTDEFGFGSERILVLPNEESDLGEIVISSEEEG